MWLTYLGNMLRQARNKLLWAKLDTAHDAQGRHLGLDDLIVALIEFFNKINK